VVYRSLSGADDRIDPAALARLRASYQMAALGHSRCLVELDALSTTLSGLSEPWLIVKGPVLIALGYGDAGSRLYEDLDIVVTPGDLADGLTAVEASGGRVCDLNWPMMSHLRRAEIPLVLPSGMLGDLHWHLLVTPNARARFRLSMEEVRERRRTVTIGETRVATLDVVDGLLYLCLHGSMSGGHHLVWLKDLDQMVVAEPPDWDELVRRARASGADLVAALQLERAREVLGAPVPREVIDTLAGGSAWCHWWERDDRRVGMARWGGYRHTGRTVMSATSAGTIGSARQLVRSLAQDVVGPGLRARLAPAGDEDGDVSPELYRPVGGALERGRYLEQVRSDSSR
jgi:hypothetical protein